MSTLPTAEISATFMKLQADLEKAYGLGVFPNKEKIEGIIDEALVLTGSSAAVTQEECDFYKSASKKVAPTSQHFSELADAVDAIVAVVFGLEQAVKGMQGEFLSKSDAERMEYLTSASYSQFAEQANDDTRTIAEIAQRVKDLLFKPRQGFRANPYKDLATFAEHRKSVTELYNRVANLSQRHAAAVSSITPEALYASDTLASKVKRAVSKHPYAFSIPLGAAIAAGGAYGLPALGVREAFTAITHALGLLTAAAPWIFK